MNLSTILPPSRQQVHAESLPGMVINALLVACQQRSFKRLTKWSGLAPCIGGGRAWTCRISNIPGVYGIMTSSVEDHPLGPAAHLDLFYFPAPEEDILERMSLTAAYAAAKPEYTDAIREFPSWGEMVEAFRIASIDAALEGGERALQLTLCAEERLLVITKDGVTLPDGTGWLIAPGEAEVDIPAREMAMPVFNAIAAALSLCLEEPPCRFARTTRPGQARVYTSQGRQHLQETGTSSLIDALGWGDRDRCDSLAALLPEGETTVHEPGALPDDIKDALLWKTHKLSALAQNEEYAAAFDFRPRLIVLSGFLGAGKTTFLNQLLEYHAARDEMVAIIQNEIGETGVDGKLLEGDDSIVELDEGCVCCTLAGSLSRGIEKLTSSFHPETIVLEATGLANPFNLLGEIGELRHLVRFDSVTTLVDAANAPAILDASDIANDQIRAADILIVNKCDLIDDAKQEALITRLRALNSRAPLVQTSHGQVNPGLLYDADPTQAPAPGLMPAMPGHSHGSHEGEGFSSKRFSFSAPLKRDELCHVLGECPADVFRIKGIVRMEDSGKAEVVQYVGGRFELSPLGEPFDDESFLVAIGKNTMASGLQNLPGANFSEA